VNDPLRPADAATRVLPHGTRLGRYRLGQRLGVGGMAEVYLAVADGPHGFEKRVAIKLLHPHAAGHSDRIAELHREARIAATLEHPNIAQVLDVGNDRGEVFLAMEYVHGKDLRDVLVAHGRGRPFPLECALAIVIDIARGLHHAHERRGPDGRSLGLVHRDVSPSNVLVSHDGAVKVADFGLVKVDTASVDTQTGVLKGKFGYMSPEQTRGRAVDRRSDVYALGIVLYELTLARRAFTGLNAFEIMNKVMSAEFTHPRAIDPEYPEALAAIVVRAMALLPDDRYATAAELAAALEAFARERGLHPGPAALAAFMERLFGRPEEPAIAFAPERAEPVEAVEGVAVAPASTRGRIAAAAFAAAIVAGGLGWWLGAGRAAATDRTAVPQTDVVPSEVAREDAKADAHALDAPRDLAAPASALEATAQPDAPAAAGAPANESSASPRASRRKPHRRKPKSPRSSTSPAPRERDLTSMFPAPLE
jgi:hypothetical protein